MCVGSGSKHCWVWYEYSQLHITCTTHTHIMLSSLVYIYGERGRERERGREGGREGGEGRERVLDF